jgi:hypothetical protein
MATTVYVVDPDSDERKWIDSVLGPTVDAVVFFDDAAAQPLGEWCARRPGGPIRAATDNAYVERKAGAASGAAIVG